MPTDFTHSIDVIEELEPRIAPGQSGSDFLD